MKAQDVLVECRGEETGHGRGWHTAEVVQKLHTACSSGRGWAEHTGQCRSEVTRWMSRPGRKGSARVGRMRPTFVGGVQKTSPLLKMDMVPRPQRLARWLA